MKNLRSFALPLSLALICTALFCSAADVNTAPKTQSTSLKIALVNFKTCVENSKLGKQEQANFEVMKKQMETVLLEKEKALTDIASKFNDIDYLDSLSPEAEAKLKSEFRTFNQEFNQQQNQFYQVLSQTNVKVVQGLTDAIVKASAEIAKKNEIDLVLNAEESSFYVSPHLDISKDVVTLMDTVFENESKANKTNSALESVK